MNKVHLDYDRLIADMDARRRQLGLSVRELARQWDIRPATLVEWKTRKRKPATTHVLLILKWLDADITAYVEQA